MKNRGKPELAITPGSYRICGVPWLGTNLRFPRPGSFLFKGLPGTAMYLWSSEQPRIVTSAILIMYMVYTFQLDLKQMIKSGKKGGISVRHVFCHGC